MQQTVLITILMLLTMWHIYITSKLHAVLGYSVKSRFLSQIRMFVPAAALMLSMAMFRLPLVLFYILCYFLKGWCLYSFEGKKSWQQTMINLWAASMSSVHLILIGIIALATDHGLSGVMAGEISRIVSLILMLVCEIVCGMIIIKKKNAIKVIEEGCTGKDFRPFEGFLWFCNVYVLLESVLCRFDLLILYTPLFLIGSNILLLYLIFSFLKNIHDITKSLSMEDEYIALKKQIQELERSTSDLRSSAFTDALTGIYSRSYVLTRLRDMVERHEAFSLAYLDLDRLKSINDQLGHREGDRYICQFTGFVGKRLRKGDIFGRIGGDEFLILMPNCERESSQERLTLIQSALLREDFGQLSPISFSFGLIGVSEENTKAIDILMDEADRAMYEDKQESGRRRGKRHVQ